MLLCIYMIYVRNIAVAVVALAVFVVPVMAQAQIFGALIPTCGGNFGEDCSFCNLLWMGQKIINFFIYLSVVVATFLFTYAGVLYMTSAPNPGNIEKAHKIFWNVLIGLIVVLGAWLIVDTVMKVFYSESDFGPWNAILCQAGTAFEYGEGGGGGVVVGERGPAGVAMAHDDAINSINEANATLASTGGGNIRVCSTTGCGTSSVYAGCSSVGCTSLEGIGSDVVRQTAAIASGCGCTVTITGGTESGAGHAAGACSHGSGCKIDLDDNPQVDSYIRSQTRALGTRDGYERRLDGNGNEYVLEGNHWDIAVPNGLCVYTDGGCASS
jgi:hypothetical protein